MTAPARLRQSQLPGSAAEWAQFARFVAVGVSNTLVSFALYTALILAATPYWAAGAIAFAAGSVNGYVLNRRWTFDVADSIAARTRYVAVQLCGLGATSGLLWLLVSDAGFDRIAAYVLAIPVVTIATFLANRNWAFAVV